MRRKAKAALPIPLEAAEQSALFRWAALSEAKYPDLHWLYAVPNGGSRHLLEAVHLKEQGVKSGVPDICLPSPRGGFHGLYIELKRQHGGVTSENQTKWIEHLKAQGYAVALCRGFYEAEQVITQYLKHKTNSQEMEQTHD
ncbi:hypothetical protein FACS18948_3180 [Clostridia bacterium]|nr:hypothetical protein FACS18948_3180 [Clostridia bacterium]